MTVRYNVTNASNPTQLYTYMSQEGITVNGALMFDKVVIDGTEVSISDLDAASGQTQFTLGEHTVKYALKEPTFIGIDGDPSDPSSVKIGATFFSCENVISVEIPNGVTTFGEGAFSDCRGLTSVTIPNSVTSIGDGAFQNCSALTSVTIGNSVTSIGESAFYYCSALASITIPDSVTAIGNSAFASCTGLTSITSLATTAPTITSSTFRDVKTNGTLTVPIGSSGYDVWMRTGNYYLGKYNWTKVEQ